MEHLGRPRRAIELDECVVERLAKRDDHVVVPGPVRKELDQVTPSNPTQAGLLAAVKRLEAATVSVDFGRDPVIRAEFRADNADGAAALHDGLKKGLEAAKAAWAEERKNAEKALLQGWAKPALALLGSPFSASSIRACAP